MRVYLAAAMTNRDRDAEAISAILATIEEAGHEVPTRHVAARDGRMNDLALTPAELTARDFGWLHGCDALIAEISTPSHGVGVEVMAALHARIPVLLVWRNDAMVSRMLLGLPGLETGSYATISEACTRVSAFLTDRC